MSSQSPLTFESLAEFRRELLNCNTCFQSPRRCRHHEDIVGGYERDRIVVIGINPQAHPSDRVYQTIQSAAWERKARLGDLGLKIATGSATFDEVDASWKFMNGQHRGRGWINLVQRCLGITPQQLASHFLFVETFKHATANLASLTNLQEWSQIEQECPRWLAAQLGHLKPRLIVLCGGVAKKLVSPTLEFDDVHDVVQMPMRVAHGTTRRSSRYACDVQLALAIARRNRSSWDHHDKTESIRQRIQQAINERCAQGGLCANAFERDRST